MNELIKLDAQITEIDKRFKYLNTKEGRIKTEQSLVEVFAVMEAYGYRSPQGNVALIVRAWVDMLQTYIGVYGIDLIKQAFKKFAETDNRNYKDFPKPSDIMDKVKEIGGRDPRIIKSQLKCKEREKIAIENWKKENEEFWKGQENE